MCGTLCIAMSRKDFAFAGSEAPTSIRLFVARYPKMRNRPRRTNTQITTVLQAFVNEYHQDMDAFDSMILSMEPGEGVIVENGKLTKVVFSPKWLAPNWLQDNQAQYPKVC